MQELSDFLEQSKGRLQYILDQLNWTSNNVILDNHANSKEHTDANKEDLFPPSCTIRNSVVLSDSEISKLLNKTIKAPQKFSDLQLNFNREEKLMLYEHVKEQREAKVPCLDENADLVSIADIVAMKKREKKHRRKHRVSKPTHTEELRSLVELQMQSLEQYLKTKHISQSTHEYDKNEKRRERTSKKSDNSKIIENYEPNLNKQKYNKKSEYSHDRANQSSSKERYRHRARSKERRHSNDDGYYKSRQRSRSRSYSNSRRRDRSKERQRKTSAERRRSRSYDRQRSHSKDRCKDRYNERKEHIKKKTSDKFSHKHKKKRSRSPKRNNYKSKSSKKRSRGKSKKRKSRSRSRIRIKEEDLS